MSLFLACANDATKSDSVPFSEWKSLTEFETEVGEQIVDSNFPLEIQVRLLDDSETKEYRASFTSFSDPFSFVAFTDLTEENLLIQKEILTTREFSIQHLGRVTLQDPNTFTGVWVNESGLTAKSINPTDTEALFSRILRK